MEGCEFGCDRALAELYCRDCRKWICPVCFRIHQRILTFAGGVHHNIISAAEQWKQQLAHPLKQQLTHIHAKCSQQIGHCDEAIAVLNENKVTSLELSSSARQSCHKQIDQLFDNIDERLTSFAVTNTATYMLARERLTDSMTQLRQLQCSIEETLYKISSDPTSVDVRITHRFQSSLDEMLNNANECVAASVNVPTMSLAVNLSSLDGVASLSLDEVCRSSCDDVQQPKDGVIKFERNLLADYVIAKEYDGVIDLTKSHSDQPATPSNQLNVVSSRSRPPADDVGDSNVAAAAVSNHPPSPCTTVFDDDCQDGLPATPPRGDHSTHGSAFRSDVTIVEDMTIPAAAAVSNPPSPCCARFDDCQDSLSATPPQIDDSTHASPVRSDVKTVRVVHVKDVSFSKFVTQEYDSSALTSRHGRQLKQPDRY